MPQHRNHGNRDRRNGGDENRSSLSKTFKDSPSKDYIKKWITEGIDDDCIQFADEFGTELIKGEFTTSQIRNVFGEIKRIQMKGILDRNTDFLLLKPKMAYAAKRAKKRGADAFRLVLEHAHTAVRSDLNKQEEYYQNFCDFVEAILAYHRANGGKD